MITIQQAGVAELDILLPMAEDLWSDTEPAELKTLFTDLLVKETILVLIACRETESVGFIYLGIRHDYVEGSDTSPTGYIEGIYVKSSYRQTGIAKDLYLAGEQWVREKGCTQVGSDIAIENTISHQFHEHLGFKEAARLIAFIKNI